MNIGDNVRFLNDVGGGKIVGFRPGGIVLVEDKEGFDMPVPQNEVVVIEEDLPQKESQKPVSKVKHAPTPHNESASQPAQTEVGHEGKTLKGKEYLQSKTAPVVQEEVDEQLEARVVRLEMTIQKLEARIALLEAENNLRKNEARKVRLTQPKPHPQPKDETTLGDLQIL